MVNWLKKIFSNAKAYIIAGAGAVFGVLCLILGFKNRKIDKLKLEKATVEAEKKREEQKRRVAEISEQTAAHIATETSKIDAQTVEQISNVPETATGQEYNDVVQGFAHDKDTNTKANKGRSK